MVEASAYAKERRTLLKLVGIKLLKRLKKNGGNPSGASTLASSFVDGLSDEEVILKLEKLKRNQQLVELSKNKLSRPMTGKEIRELGSKRFFGKSTRIKRAGKV